MAQKSYAGQRARAIAGPASGNAAPGGPGPPSQTPSIRSGSVSNVVRVAVHQDQVGQLAGLDRAEVAVDAQQLGRAPRRRLEHRRGRHPEPGHQRELAQVAAVGRDARNRCPSRPARRPRSRVRDVPTMDVGEVDRPCRARPAGTRRRPRAASITACGATSVGTSHVPRSSMSSIPSSSRKIPCSIERMPARTAFLIPSARLGVGHHEHPGRGRLGHEHVQLVGPEVRVGGVVAGREHAARGRHLDHVRAHPVQLADLAPHLVGAVDDPRRHARIRRQRAARGRRTRASRPPWPPVWLIIARLICIRGPSISPSASACWMPRSAPPASRTEVIAGPERRLEVPRRFVELVGERRVRLPPQVDMAAW